MDETHTEDFQLAGSKKGVRILCGKAHAVLSASLTPFTSALRAGMLKVMLSLVSYFFPDAAAGNTAMMFNFLGNTLLFHAGVDRIRCGLHAEKQSGLW